MYGCTALLVLVPSWVRESNAQQAGSIIQVDFERREPVFKWSKPVGPAFTAGPVIQVDFERREPVFKWSKPVGPAFTAGPVIQVDFERREPVFKVQR